MKTITVEQFEKLGACTEEIAWLKKQKNMSIAALVEAAIFEKKYTNAEGEDFNTLDFANWGLTRVMTRVQAVKYAIFSARQVLRIYEKKYPNDNRVRAAIEAAEAWVGNPSIVAAAWAGAAGAAGAAAEHPLKAKILRYGVKLILKESKE